jgi:hypothetical protein
VDVIGHYDVTTDGNVVALDSNLRVEAEPHVDFVVRKDAAAIDGTQCHEVNWIVIARENGR